MDSWNPHNLSHCLDSPEMAYLTAGLALGMLFWYLMIAWQWWRSLKMASHGGKLVWGWLIAIFVVCAMAGYVALVFALWFPKLSVLWRIAFLSIQNFVCPVFWVLAKRHHFTHQGAYERIGSEMAEVDTYAMSDKELASTVRRMVADFMERKARSNE